MLTLADANDATDRRIAEGLAKRTGGELRVLKYTREPKDAARLRDLLEVSSDYTGGVSPTNRRDGPAFFYLCRAPQGLEIAKGEGDTPELAICDGLLDFLSRPLRH
jgi:hypothetical protein